jgi:hypothetical protein
MTQQNVVLQQLPLRCPVCGGKFVHIGDMAVESTYTYIPWDAEPLKVIGCSFNKLQLLSLGAIRVCLGCGVVGHFVQGNELERLRQKEATGEADVKKP